MGRSNPSARGYATPTYSTTQITARETFGGPAKAGLGRHIGMGEWTFGAIVNGSSGRSGHTAPPFAGMNFPKAFHAGRLPYLHYPISKTNQLARIGVGTTGGMTRTPADGVNPEQRKAMELRVGHWNAFWPARPIRDTPNNCCYVDPVGKMDLNNLVYTLILNALETPYTDSNKIYKSFSEITQNLMPFHKWWGGGGGFDDWSTKYLWAYRTPTYKDLVEDWEELQVEPFEGLEPAFSNDIFNNSHILVIAHKNSFNIDDDSAEKILSGYADISQSENVSVVDTNGTLVPYDTYRQLAITVY